MGIILIHYMLYEEQEAGGLETWKEDGELVDPIVWYDQLTSYEPI